MGRVADIFLHGDKVGVLQQSDKGYSFAYSDAYVQSGKAAISVSLPVTMQPYETKELHGFFAGLLAEGWLRKTQAKTQQIHADDLFGLLVENGHDLIGAVTIELQNLS